MEEKNDDYILFHESENLDSKPQIYFKKLKEKIRDQAKRLIELQSYSIICEKKIKQLCPSQIFPIKETDILNNYNNNTSDTAKLNHQLSELKNLINQKDQQLLNYMKEIQKKNDIKVNHNENIYSDNYKFNELYQNHEKVLNTLREQTIINEEQKAYIETLKQTIEQTLNKIDFNKVIQFLSNKYKYKSPLDYLVDLNQVRSEADIYKKESILNSNICKNLNDEIQKLKNEKFNLQVQNTNRDEANNAIEIENKSLRSHLDSIQSENHKIKQENEMYKRGFDEKNDELNKLKTINEESRGLSERYHNLEIELKECRKTNMELMKNIDELSRIKGGLSEQNYNLNSEIKQKTETISDLNRIIGKLESQITDNKNKEHDFQILDQKIREIENLNYEIKDEIRIKERRLKDSEGKLKFYENESDELKRKLKLLNIEIDEIKRSSLMRLEQFEKEKSHLYTKIEKNKEENHTNLKIIQDLKNDNENLNKELTNLNKEINMLNQERKEKLIVIEDYNSIEKENESIKYKLNLFEKENRKLQEELRIIKNQLDNQNQSLDKRENRLIFINKLLTYFQNFLRNLFVFLNYQSDNTSKLFEELNYIVNYQELSNSTKLNNFNFNLIEKTLNIVLTETEKKLFDLNKSQNYISNLEEKNFKLTEDNKILLNEFEKIKKKFSKNIYNKDITQIQCLENTIIFLIKEKKYIENLLIKLSNFFENNKITQVLINIIKTKEDLFKKEREKSQIEKKINDNNNENQIELEKLLLIRNEYENSLSETKKLMDYYENELSQYEKMEKINQKNFFDYEKKCRSLELEISELKTKLNITRINHI